MASSEALEVFLRHQWAPRTFEAVQTPLGEQQTGSKFQTKTNQSDILPDRQPHNNEIQDCHVRRLKSDWSILS